MTLVRKTAEGWEVLRGRITLTQMVDTAAITYRDGRCERVKVESYPVDTAPLDAGKVERLLAEGVWGDAEKQAFGIAIAEPFVVPEGKRRVGDLSIVEVDGVPAENFEVEDLPPPPPPPTPAQKLAEAGLTQEELDQVIAESIARQKGDA